MQRRLMFFGDGDQNAKQLSGKVYPHPALVFMIQGRELFVRALAEQRRPKADTRLKNAPYWNTDVRGRVCLGSMRVPEEVGVGSLPGWENAYFASEFTHPKWRYPTDNSSGRISWPVVKPGGASPLSDAISG